MLATCILVKGIQKDLHRCKNVFLCTNCVTTYREVEDTEVGITLCMLHIACKAVTFLTNFKRSWD
jgi:hypothetical protein